MILEWVALMINTYFCLQLVGSAPQFPHGIIDSIEEICQVSQLNELLDRILKL